MNGKRLLKDLADLAAIGAEAGGGVTRRAFSPAFWQAADWLQDRMMLAGLDARMDAAGNIIGRIGPPEVPALVCGSHIDTVPNGGAYDGALGVVAGLECARVLGDAMRRSRLALEVIAFADEEGAYISLFGSRSMTGTLDPAFLEGSKGRALADAMEDAGLEPSSLFEARRPVSDFAGYVELHIEQGPVLEAAGVTAGIVESIVGMDLLRYNFRGEARHAGTTPMTARRDAGRGACLAVTEAYAALEASPLAETGRMTFGSMALRPGVGNVVPAEAEIVSEVRAQSREDLAQLRSMTDTVFRDVANRERLMLHADDHEIDLPVPLCRRLIDLADRAAVRAGIATHHLHSGACHDAQVFAPFVPTGMVFVASRGGVSHHADEYSSPEAVIDGAQILLGTIETALTSLG